MSGFPNTMICDSVGTESVMEQQSEILAEPWCVFHAQNENVSSFSSSCLLKMLEVEPLGLSYY